jgi:hypothetical protein
MKHLRVRIAICALTLAFAAQSRGQDLTVPEASEYLIKAGYVYNFAKLVEWPAAAVEKDQPMVIGVLGNDNFANVLTRVVDGKKIDERSFVVKRLKGTDYKTCHCHILFIGASEMARAEEIVQFQSTASLLTIAETPDFARRGGVIALTLEDNRVRFTVNIDAATQASLNISSRLLTLANIVHSTR